MFYSVNRAILAAIAAFTIHSANAGGPNILAEAPSLDGETAQLLSDSANCDYGFAGGVVRNSANLVIEEFCWRLNRSTGQIIVQIPNGDYTVVQNDRVHFEDFNWTDNGHQWVRAYLR